MKGYIRDLKLLLLGTFHPFVFRKIKKRKKRFTCPICNYHGPFIDVKPKTGLRRHAKCPKCRLLERHRLQYLVVNELSKSYDFSKMSMLHFAPETFFRNHFRKLFGNYTTADLFMSDVDFKADLRNLEFEDQKYDFVFASHVLEHIKEDYKCLSEIRRVMKSGGIALLPVPIVANRTIEYQEPNPYDDGHVRAPGPDYYQRYRKYFSKVHTYQSSDFPHIYQTIIYEDRNNWPKTLRLRPTMDGGKHVDIVPVCYV